MCDLIEQARQTALQQLKPSARDLEYGLKLHRESLVCDSYGFGPHAAPDGTALKQMVEQGYSPQLLRDALERMKMTRFLHNPRERQEYDRAWDAAGVTCVFQNAGFESQFIPQTLKRLAHYTHVTDTLAPYVRKSVAPQDILNAHRDHQHALVLTCNVVPLTQQWEFPEEELSFIHYFFELGCRMMHLTYNRRNMLGDGCMEPANGGLSDFGKKTIELMNRVGMIVDVAHSGQQTSLEAAQHSSRPIVASHSGVYDLNPHPRNKTDHVIRAIIEKQGTVGVCAIPAFLGQTGDINALLNHIDHLAQTYGTDYVTIGTDRPYHSRYTQQEMSQVNWPQTAIKPFEYLWLPDDPLFQPQWNAPDKMDSIAWTNWPLFTVGLVQRGYSDQDIQKILSGNILRVLSAHTQPLSD